MKKPLWQSALLVLIVTVFAAGGLVNMVGPQPIVSDFVRWGYPAWFHIVTGLLEMCAAGLLVFARTRTAGAVLGCTVMAAAVATLIRHSEFLHMLPGIVMFVATAFVGWGARQKGLLAAHPGQEIEGLK